MEHRTLFGSVALSWLGSITSAVSSAHTAVSVVALVLSAAASWYAIKVARKTISVRQLEDVEHQQTICTECLSGNPPAECPFPKGHRPKACKQKNA